MALIKKAMNLKGRWFLPFPGCLKLGARYIVVSGTLEYTDTYGEAPRELPKLGRDAA